MTEQLENTGEGQEQTPPEKTFSPIEQKAMEMGWRPLEEFDGDETDFVDAKEFVGRQPLYEGLSSVKKQLKSTQAALDAMKTHYTKVHETAYQKALNELKMQKKEALKEGEVDTFYAIEEKIESMEAEKQAFMEEQRKISIEEPAVHPDLEAWVQQNNWYVAQPHMRALADDVAQRFKMDVASGRMTAKQVLQEVDKEVRKEFPHKFRNPNKDKAPSVEASSSRSTKPSADAFEMTEQEKNVMNTLLRQKDKKGDPLISKEQYIRDLKAAKGVK